MRTADLIDSLATEVRPVGHEQPTAALTRALVMGGAVSLALLLLIYGVQPGLAEAGLMPFLMKAAYATALGGIALAAMARLARPDGERGSWAPVLVPVGALAAIAVAQLATTPADAIVPAMLGNSWDRCPWRIAALSLPILGALLFTARRQAPTALRRAGAAAGLAAGATAAIVYALACTEQSPAFVMVWYSLGLSATTALGALVGPRLLRW